MASSDSDSEAFAAAWLRQQREFWSAFQGAAGAPDWREAEAQWDAACERWHAAVADTAPPALRPALDAALDHTRLSLRLAVQMAQGMRAGASPAQQATDAGAWLLSPQRLFQAADAALRRETGNASTDDAAQVEALAAANILLARIAQDTLATVRERLRDGPTPSPAALLGLYCEALESCYLAVASSAEFARVAGDLVNTWVDAHARRAGNGPSGDRARSP